MSSHCLSVSVIRGSKVQNPIIRHTYSHHSHGESNFGQF